MNATHSILCSLLMLSVFYKALGMALSLDIYWNAEDSSKI